MAVSGNDGSIVLNTKVDDSGINAGMSKLKSGIGAVGKAFAAVGVVAAAGFAAISKSAIDSYAEYEQLAGGVETLFKDSADTLMKYADQAYKTAGLSANEYMSTVTSFSASLLQSLGGDTEKAANYADQAIIDMSDNANKMGTSMEMIQNAYQGFAKQNYTMLDNLKLGYGGTKEEMQRLLEDAEKLSGIKYDISSFADITQAIHVIQTEMGITGTTAKEASTTIQGSIGQMKGAWENLMTGIVDANADLPQLMDNLADSIVTVFDNLSPAIERTMESLPQVITKLGNKLINMVPKMFGSLVPEIIKGAKALISTLADTLAKNAKLIGYGIAEIADIIVDAIIDIIPVIIKAGKNIIQGLIKGIIALYPKLSVAVMSIGSLFAVLKIAPIVSNVVTGFKSIMSVLTAYQTAVAASQHVSVLLASTMTPLQLAIGVLTGKVSLATAAQVAWNAVLNMNPVVLAVAGAAALAAAVTGAIIAFDSYLEKNSEIVIATQNIANSAQEAAQKAQDLNTAMSSLSENAATTIMDAEAEAYANNILAEELYDLAEKTVLTATEKQRMQVIVEQLNGSVEGLNLALDEETGHLNMTEDAVRECIAQKLELAKANAIQELYTEQLKKQYEAEAQAIENARGLAEAQEILNGYIVEGTTLEWSYQMATREEKKAMKNAKEAIENYSTALENNKSAVMNAYSNMENLSAATGVDLPASFKNAKQETEGFFQALTEQTGEASKGSEQKGNDYGDGYTKGILAKKEDAYNAGYALGLEALRGTKDAQDSDSPAKESAELGGDYGDGYVIGIKSKEKDAKNAGESIAKSAVKGTATTIKEAKKQINSATKALIKDTRSEVQKVLDEINEEKLESEKLYAEESIRLKDSKSEADKAYLDDLKKTAETERKIYDARQRDIENFKQTIVDTYNTVATEALDNIEDLQKAQQGVEDGLKAFRGYMEEPQKTKNKYASTQFFDDDGNIKLFGKETAETKLYGELMTALKDREGMPAELWDTILNMSFDDSLKLARILTNMSDAQFSGYIQNWARNQQVSEEVANALQTDDKLILTDFGEQNEELERYADLMDRIKSRGIPDDLFDVLRDMPLDEGMEFANALLDLTDEDFAQYLEEWQRNQQLSKDISKQLYKDEAESLATEITDMFDEVNKEMYSIGGDAATEFGEGFISELKFVVHDIKRMISSALSGVTLGGIGTVVTGDVGINYVPAMATGGIVPHKTFAMIGEAGTEAVLPLENNTGWMDMLADRLAGRIGVGASKVVLEIDGREFGNAVVELGSKESRRIGTRLVTK